MFLTSSDTKRTMMHLFLFTKFRPNFFQYVRRVHATAINFSCISTLSPPNYWKLNTIPETIYYTFKAGLITFLINLIVSTSNKVRLFFLNSFNL